MMLRRVAAQTSVSPAQGSSLSVGPLVQVLLRVIERNHFTREAISIFWALLRKVVLRAFNRVNGKAACLPSTAWHTLS